MFAEWSAECSETDPVLVVPWSDPNSHAAFVDLRARPYDFDAIPEAHLYPTLMHALRALNAARSPFFTAKCDAWKMDEQELEALRFHLDVEPDEATAGFASYIDFVVQEPAAFVSFPRHEALARRLVRLTESLDHPAAAMDSVLRPAFVDLDGAREGYAISLYIKAAGPSDAAAVKHWSAALDAVVALLRGADRVR